MDVFITKRNAIELKIEMYPKTLAAIDGPPTVAINFGTAQQQVISVTDHGTHHLARIDKAELLDSGEVRMVHNFILDETQLPSKDKIVEDSEMTYRFDGGSGDEDSFVHTFPDDVHSGDPQSKTFRIIKSVKVALIPKLKEDMEALLKKLLSEQL